MPHENADDLDWLAFCYVAGELSPDQAAAFEKRLASDQEAREAVAAAVDLTCAVVAADAPDHAPKAAPAAMSGPWWRKGLAGRLAWTGVAASVCLAVILAYQHYHAVAPVADSRPNTAGGEAVTDANGRVQRLAVLWNRTREELASVEFADRAVDLREELDDSMLLPAEGETDEDVYAADVPPTWMLVAVRATGGRPDTGDTGTPRLQEN